MKKKTLLIDTSEICYKLNGTAQYVINLIHILDKYFADDYILYLLLNPAIKENDFLSNFDNLKIEIIFSKYRVKPIGPKRDLKYIFISWKLKSSIDLYICPTEKWPLFMKSGVFILHDARAVDKSFIGLNKLKRIYLRNILKSGFRNSTSFITVSQSTMTDFQKFMQLDISSKGTVVYSTRPKSAYLDFQNIDSEIKALSSEKYFFFFGQLWRPHKNIEQLIKAFKHFKLQNHNEYKLLLAGDDKRTLDTDLLSESDIVYLGYINENERQYLLAHAQALVNVSLFEGFSFPILEALENNVEVICSTIDVFKELYSGMVHFVDPHSVNSIVDVFVYFCKKAMKMDKNRLAGFSEEVYAEKINSILKKAILER